MDVLPAELWGQVHGLLEWERTHDFSLASAYLAHYPICKRVRHKASPADGPAPAACKHNTRRGQEALGRVHTLELHNCPRLTTVAGLAGVHTLSLRGCKNIANAHALARVHTLDLGDGASDQLYKFRALANVHWLNLSHSFICDEDVACLSRVHTLTLHSCEISDVSALGGVHHLDLSGCRNISDVSALSRVHTLLLKQCPGIADVAFFRKKLGGVHTLDLSGCVNVRDVSALKSVHTLLLDDLSDIDATPLGGNARLSVKRHRGVLDVSALGRVEDLDLSECDEVRSLSRLTGLRVLSLAEYRAAFDPSPFGRCRVLDLRECLITDVSALGRVTFLTLSDCDNS